MNKKILSILVIIMALSLFTISCSYAGTSPSGSGTGETTPGDGGTTPGDGGETGGPTVVTAETITSAIKTILGNTIEIAPNITVSTTDAHVTLSDSTISLKLVEDYGMKQGSIAHTIKYLNDNHSVELKQALILQGIDIQGNLVFEKSSRTAGQNLYINLKADSIKPNPDTEAYTLPPELKDKKSITIEFHLYQDMGWSE